MNAKNLGFDQFPEWRNLKAKIVEMQLEATELEARLGKLEAEKWRPKIDDEAHRLLYGDERPADSTVTKEEIERLRQRLTVLRAAIELGRDDARKLEAKLSAEICAKLQPEYRGIVDSMVKTLHPLHEVVQKERQFRTALEAAGISFAGHIRPMPWGKVGHIGDSQSRIRHYYGEVKEYYGLKHPGFESQIKEAERAEEEAHEAYKAQLRRDGESA